MNLHLNETLLKYQIISEFTSNEAISKYQLISELISNEAISKYQLIMNLYLMKQNQNIN